MNETTSDPSPSSPSPQEVKDAIARRTATVAKATTRVEEITGYLGLIDKAVAGTLPEFVALHPMGQAIDDFAKLEDACDALEKAVKLVASRISYAREVSFPARMDAEESKTFTAESGNRMTRTIRLFASIVSDTTGETLKKAYAYLRENELGSLIKETVNSSSLSGAVKEAMENGREFPEELFKVHMKDGVSITRKKAK